MVRIVLDNLGGVCVTRWYEVLDHLGGVCVTRWYEILDHLGGVCGGTNSLRSSWWGLCY